jgi:surfactin synthase thioesterase subunit
MKGYCVMSELEGPDQWIRRLVPAPSANQLLLRLPHAGGSATYFWPLAQVPVPQAGVFAAQYPGRQERHHLTGGSDPQVDLDAVVDHIRTLLLGNSVDY